MFEELKELDIVDANYDLYQIHIGEGDQFGSDFVKINPNSKIPALVDQSQEPRLEIFESGSILFYLAEKFNQFIPEDIHGRTETINWLFWQIGSAPYVGGNSVISSPIRLSKLSTQLTGSQWKRNVS